MLKVQALRVVIEASACDWYGNCTIHRKTNSWPFNSQTGQPIEMFDDKFGVK